MLADSGIKILNIMQIHKISNKLSIIFWIFAFIGLNLYCTSRAAAYNKPKAENYKAIENEADRYFYEGLQVEDKSLKEAYLSEAMEKYMLLLDIYPNNATVSTHLGVIHDNLGHTKIAKDYFFRAMSIEPNNPYISFYLAEYFYVQKQYENALKYYKLSYNNGYRSLYEVNLKLGTTYEKLGDIPKAKKYYSAAGAIKPGFSGLENKIKSLDKVYYSKSNYKQ